MSRRARSPDNARAEGFFGTLKCDFFAAAGLLPGYIGRSFARRGAMAGMCFPQLIDAAFKDCPKLPAGKERPQVPGFRSIGDRLQCVPNDYPQNEGLIEQPPQ